MLCPYEETAMERDRGGWAARCRASALGKLALAAGEFYAAEGFGGAVHYVVEAPLPGVRFLVVEEIVAEDDRALVVLEKKRKVVWFRIGDADGFEGQASVIVEPDGGELLGGVVPGDVDGGLVVGLAQGVLMARDFANLQIVMIEDPFGVHVVLRVAAGHGALQRPFADQVIEQRGC